MQGYCDRFKGTRLPEVKCLHAMTSRCKICTPSSSNVIYHKFSHGAVSHMLNEQNVNVMLELYKKENQHISWDGNV